MFRIRVQKDLVKLSLIRKLQVIISEQIGYRERVAQNFNRFFPETTFFETVPAIEPKVSIASGSNSYHILR